MPRVRPLSELGDAVAALGIAAGKLPPEVVDDLAKRVRDTVAWQGAKYRLTPKKYPLEAKVSRGRKATRINAALGASASVEGTPAGFWRIVEDGSNQHFISGRYRQSGSRFGRVARQRAFTRTVLGDNEAFNQGTPINIPGVGWRQYAHHPGHGSIGKPWKTAMALSQGLAGESLRKTATIPLRKAWGA